MRDPVPFYSLSAVVHPLFTFRYQTKIVAGASQAGAKADVPKSVMDFYEV